MQLIRRFLKNSDGATAIEYALICVCIFMAILGGMQLLGKKTGSHYNYVADEVGKAL